MAKEGETPPLQPVTLSELPIEVFHNVLKRLRDCVARTLSRKICMVHDECTSRLTFTISAGMPSPRACFAARISSCPGLAEVKLAPSESVDDSLVVWLIATLPSLRKLDVSFCPKLTASVLVRFRNAPPTLAWRAEGCFFEPSPALDAAGVVRSQLYALRMNNDEGIATSFAFAAPANKLATGPLSRFARMIREGYGGMLRWRKAYVKEDPRMSETGWPATRALYTVLLVDSEGACEAFRWFLEVQRQAGYAGCWMTMSVGGAPPSDAWGADGRPQGLQLDEPPWGLTSNGDSRSTDW